MDITFAVIVDQACWRHKNDEWTSYTAVELPDVADLLKKPDLTDEDWQRVIAAIRARVHES